MAYSEGPWSGFLQARYSGKGYYDKRTAPTDLPPAFSGGGNNYDPIGRFYRVGVKVEF